MSRGHRLHPAVVMAQGHVFGSLPPIVAVRMAKSQRAVQDRFVVRGFNMELVPEEAWRILNACAAR